MRKRLYILYSILAVMVLLISALPVAAAQVAQTPIAGSTIPQFVDPLPDIHTIVAGTGQIELQMNEFKSMVLPSTFVPPRGGTYTGTWVWGYREPGQSAAAPYIGPVVVATRNIPTEIKFVNNLGNSSTTNVLAYKNSTDQTLHWADPLNDGANMNAHMLVPGMPPMPPGDQNYIGPIPAVPHLHGGEVPPVVDGGPEAWFTSDGSHVGSTYYSKDGTAPKNYSIYRYPNTQEAGPLWFHDHTLGATRLNVYAGLAGSYLLTDPAQALPANLPGPADIVPLVIQDRMFDTNGQLFFPSDTLGGIQYSLTPEHPYWVPEFIGDTIVVNGKVWPYKTVDPKRYRFLLLNGSNARAYELSLPAGVPIWVIGTDGGYLDMPVQVNKLVMQPGERYEVIIDFAKAAGKNLILSNSARTPYPKGSPPNGSTVGRIIQFRVNKTPVVDNSYNPALGTPLRSGTQTIKRLVNPVTGTLAAGVTPDKTRELTLNEVMAMPMVVNGIKYPGGPTEILVNNTKWGGERQNPVTGAMEPIPGSVPDGFGNYLTELPKEGDTEVWEIVNLTADAHPIHLHLVQFQLMNRQAFNVSNYTKAYNALFPASVQIDPMTGLPYAGGTAIGGFGPPQAYDFYATAPNIPARGAIYGGNPDVTPFLQSKANPPASYEAGWKDTIISYPGEVTRIAVRWAPTDKAITDPSLSYPFDPNANGQGYVWHCHIIDHEDNEMMRPDEVQPLTGAVRTFNIGSDY